MSVTVEDRRTRTSGDFKCTGSVEEKDRLEEEKKTRKKGKVVLFNVHSMSVFFLCGSSITTWEALRQRRLSLGLNGVLYWRRIGATLAPPRMTDHPLD